MRNCEQALHECAARPGQYKIAEDAKYTFQPGDQVTDDRLRRYVAPENEFAKCAYTLFRHREKPLSIVSAPNTGDRHPEFVPERRAMVTIRFQDHGRGGLTTRCGIHSKVSALLREFIPPACLRRVLLQYRRWFAKCHRERECRRAPVPLGPGFRARRG